MEIRDVQLKLILLGTDFEEDIDIDRVPLDEVTSESNVLVGERGNVSLYPEMVVSQGEAKTGESEDVLMDEVVDNYHAVMSEVRKEYPNVGGSEYMVMTTMFIIDASIDEDDSLDELTEYVEGAGMELVIEGSGEWVDSLIIQGFDEKVDGSYEAYMREFLEDFEEM